MNKLTVKLENCYGIKKLDVKFDFSVFNTFVIYAQNGIMKTSFAKTISDYISGKNSNDKVFNRSPYVRKLTDESGSEINPENIFVINSYVNSNYESANISTLLVRSDLREAYDRAHGELDNTKIKVVRILASDTQSPDCEEEIIRTFGTDDESFFEIIHRLLKEIGEESYKEYKFKYNSIFENAAVSKFIEKQKGNIQLYHDKYFEILNNSDGFFSKDVSFGTAQANDVLESVESGSFFKAGHKIVLKNNTEISSPEELTDIINREIDRVLSNPELKEQFAKIDKALRPKNVREMKEIIEGDQSLMLELVDYSEFQKKYWKSHLSRIMSELINLNDLYGAKKEEISNIILEANKETEEWKKTVGTFKERFSNLPFEVDIGNTKDSILGLSGPRLIFSFIDRETNTPKEIDKARLNEDILSTGEKRAFYLLNNIFEIQARLCSGQETLFVIDDIADSFDYKNKYAIVEYLKDLSRESIFKLIILTHNFDFFRTLLSRILTEKFKRSHSFIAEKLNGRIELVPAGSRNVTDPFSIWKSDVNSNEKYLIACIPFVRNIVEFKDNSSDNYETLTHALHYKEKDGVIKSTVDIEIADIEPIFSDILSNISFSFSDNSKKIIQVIEDQINIINSSGATASIILEDKIILAIGIRLKAEKYMWSKVTNRAPISGSQTGKLFERYKDESTRNSTLISGIRTLESVNIMTPENIHLNSFMYEPILDMSIDELKNLYNEVNRLI